VLPVRVDRCDLFVGMAFENLRLAMGMGEGGLTEQQQPKSRLPVIHCLHSYLIESKEINRYTNHACEVYGTHTKHTCT